MSRFRERQGCKLGGSVMRRGGLVQQISLMRLLGRSVIQPQIVAASGFQTFMTQDLFNVPDRTAIEQ